MILYGRNAVLEALRGRRRVIRAWVSDNADAGTMPSDLDVELVDADALERICGSEDHQGFACNAEPYPYVDAGSLLAGDDSLVVALDEIQDPQNFGAICRSAEAAGVSGVVIPERRSVEVTPSVCRASAGAVEHLAIAKVGNLAGYLLAVKDGVTWAYGAAADAESLYTAPDYRGRVVLVLGSEGKGLRPRVAEACDQLVSLPMKGRVDSLNVSATAAVLIYEVVRQRTT